VKGVREYEGTKPNAECGIFQMRIADFGMRNESAGRLQEGGLRALRKGGTIPVQW
jgi:hypothetical protein